MLGRGPGAVGLLLWSRSRQRRKLCFGLVERRRHPGCRVVRDRLGVGLGESDRVRVRGVRLRAVVVWFGHVVDACAAWVAVLVVSPFSVDALTRATVVATSSAAEIAAALGCNRSAWSFARMVLSFPVHCLNAPRSGALLARRYIRRVLRQTLVLWPYLVTAVVVLVLFVYLGISLWVANGVTRVERLPLDPPATAIAASHEDVAFRSRDGLLLRGWWFGVAGADRAVVIVHGRARNRVNSSFHPADIARMLLRH